MKHRTVFFLTSWLSVVALACDPTSESDPPTIQRSEVRTIVLLTIDTWRRDATGFLGHLDPSPTPFLDSVAAEGLVAVDAMTPVPLTEPTHWSMLTGRWPWQDGLHVNGDMPTNDDTPRMAQLLRQDGWRTSAFVSCSALDRRFGFSAGFDHFDDRMSTGRAPNAVRMSERRGDQTVDGTLSWFGSDLETGDRLFLWVHLFDPHFPYEPPSGAGRGERGGYLGEVAFADEQARRLAKGLESVGRPIDQSLWIVLADHGEALQEHGESTHGLLLHGATTRIPLIVSGPSVPKGTFDTLAATVDVFATVLDYVGIEAPETDGISLVDGPGDPERSIPMESLYAARSHGISGAFGLRWKHWLWEASPRDHLWNLVDDVDEKTDLAGNHPEIVESMRDMRDDWGAPTAASSVLPSPQLLEDLRALGYATGGMAPGTGDVREFALEGLTSHRAVVHHLRSGNHDQAEEYAMRFLARYDRSADMWLKAGLISILAGDHITAEARFRRSLELDPSNTQSRTNLGSVLSQLGRYDEAEKEYRKVLDIHPENMDSLRNMGLLLSIQERYAEASVYWEKYLELYPDQSDAAAIRARLDSWAVPTENSRPPEGGHIR